MKCRGQKEGRDQWLVKREDEETGKKETKKRLYFSYRTPKTSGEQHDTRRINKKRLSGGSSQRTEEFGAPQTHVCILLEGSEVISSYKIIHFTNTFR